MSLSGKYSPLNLNCLGSFIRNEGLCINPKTTEYIGTVNSIGSYTKGTLTYDTAISLTSDLYNRAFELTYATIVAGTFTNLTTYTIKTVGTTDFTLIGASSNTIGTRFTALGPGTGTGTAVRESGGGSIPVSTYLNLITMGSEYTPLLTNTKPAGYIREYNATTARYGFLGLFAVQAFNEFYINNGSYSDFFNVVSTCLSFKKQSNKVIGSFAKAGTFLDGAYSNMNDLITGDIAGVNLSTFFWGQDLIASGRVIDLFNIDKFGNPDVLLRTIYKNKALTRALNLALLTAGLSTNDINNIMNGLEATKEQQKLIYASFNLILNNDLLDVLIPMNCQTANLQSLADLLDPKKLFPNSYMSLTFPEYNDKPNLPTNSKTYYLLYRNGQVNKVQTLSYGDRLRNIMPDELAYACDSFSKTMMQIKNIKAVNIEKFAQVVTNLENVNGLNVNGTNVPTNTDIASTALDTVGQGTGTDGVYTTCDFFGCMTNIYYPWDQLTQCIKDYSELSGVQALFNKITDIYNLLNGGGPYTNLQNLINDVNILSEIIQRDNTVKANKINAIYNEFGIRLNKEQNARDLALPNGTKNLVTTVSDVYGFIDNLNQYALETEQYETAQFLESISDNTLIGGTSLIASMREIRNAHRLGLAGVELDNDVDIPDLAVNRAPGKATIPTIDLAGNPGTKTVNYVSGAGIAGSLGGSPEVLLIPTNLNILTINTGPTILLPEQAVQDVIRCNCDCWDMLE